VAKEKTRKSPRKQSPQAASLATQKESPAPQKEYPQTTRRPKIFDEKEEEVTKYKVRTTVKVNLLHRGWDDSRWSLLLLERAAGTEAQKCKTEEGYRGTCMLEETGGTKGCSGGLE
jgi:hypothetical protein